MKYTIVNTPTAVPIMVHQNLLWVSSYRFCSMAATPATAERW
jgi:hypothetical protein